MNDKVFENIIDENYFTLDQLFEKLFNDFYIACEVFEQWNESGLLFDGSNKERKIHLKEVHRDLRRTFKERVDHIIYDINLISKKIENGFLKDIDEQNEELENLVFNIYTANTRFHKMKDPEKEIIDYHTKLFSLYYDFKELINIYNEKARKAHKRQLLTLDKAKEIVKKTIHNMV